MLERIPKDIDYIRFTETRKIINGDFSIKHCHRLIESLALQQVTEVDSNTAHDNVRSNQDKQISVKFEFGIDDFGYRFMSGAIKTNLQLICQRCMKGVEYPIDINLSIAFMLEKDRQDEDELLGLYEAFYVGDKYEPIDLYAYIEDEILLSLPLIARHEDACIQLDQYNDDIDESFAEQVEEKKNPFDVLKTLK